MKTLRTFLSGVLLMSCCSLYSTENASAANEQAISSIVLRKGWLYFMSPSGNVIMQERISDVRTIVFTDNQSGNGTTEVQADGISIYPNPVQNLLYVKSEDESEYQIYDLDGRCLFRGKGSTIDVSSLKTGTYLLQINSQTFKFIKQ